MSEPFNLRGRVAWVTGASGGLGENFSRVLARAGAKVVLSSRRRVPLESLADSIRADGGDAMAVPADVSDGADMDRVLDIVEARYGPVDIAVCNAGVAAGRLSLDLTDTEWSRVLDTNLTGSWHVANAVARRLIAADRPGSIINITSIAGHRVGKGIAAYAASKAGLEHLTRSLSLEWARYGIRVNAIAPGYIETDMNRDFFATEAGQAVIKRIPQRRLGRTEDLDGALLLLASDASRYMTGSTIVVDGGHLQSTL